MSDTSSLRLRCPRSTRNALLAGAPARSRSWLPALRYSYRPFDNSLALLGSRDSGLLDPKRVQTTSRMCSKGTCGWLHSRNLAYGVDSAEPQVAVTSHLASLHLNEWSASMFPTWLRDDGLTAGMAGEPQRRPNLSPAAQRYLERLGATVEDLFHHVLAVLHDPAYREANSGALRMEWPRIPLPGWPDGDEDGAADELAASAAGGRDLAALLDTDTPVPGVTEGSLRPKIADVAVPSTTDGSNMTGDDFALTVGWGHFGQGEVVMPGRGRAVARTRTASEQVALGETAPILGDTTFDVYLNDRAYWRNVPAAVWHYKLGGYQVLKKWLSYREHKVLNRPLHPEEVHHFTNTARRIAAILLLVQEN